MQEIKDGMVYANYIRTLNIDEPLARIKSDDTIRYYYADALGSVIVLTDDIGQVRTQYNYSPFGETELMGEMSDNPFQYTGRENDGTGLYYYRFRYYSPYLKRFISEDPIGLLGGDLNYYVYVWNSPLRWIDPWGLFEAYPSFEDTWSNYGKYGANWSEFRKERDVNLNVITHIENLLSIYGAVKGIEIPTVINVEELIDYLLNPPEDLDAIISEKNICK